VDCFGRTTLVFHGCSSSIEWIRWSRSGWSRSCWASSTRGRRCPGSLPCLSPRPAPSWSPPPTPGCHPSSFHGNDQSSKTPVCESLWRVVARLCGWNFQLCLVDPTIWIGSWPTCRLSLLAQQFVLSLLILRQRKQQIFGERHSLDFPFFLYLPTATESAWTSCHNCTMLLVIQTES